MFKPLPLFLGLRYSRSRRRNGFIAFISASSPSSASPSG